MDSSDPLAKAQRFTQIAYSAAVDDISREYNEKRREARSRLAAHGAVFSGATIREDARLDGEQISATIKARLKVVCEGYELHDVLIDDALAATIAADLDRQMEQSITRTSLRVPGTQILPPGMSARYPDMVRQSVDLSPAWIRTEIDRRRLMKKPQPSPTPAYHIQGDNARVNINSTDHSVNVATKSSADSEDAEQGTHKVLLYVLGAAAAGGFATAQVLASIYPNAAWWLNCGSAALVLITIGVALVGRWKRLKALIAVGTSILALLVISLCWYYRHLPSGTVSPAAPQSTHVESHGDQSPNVVGNEGRVEIQNSSGETDKKDNPKPKGGK